MRLVFGPILLMLFSQPAIATTYMTTPFLNGNSFGPIFFPTPTGPLNDFGSFSGTIVTDSTLGSLATQNITDFQIEAYNGVASADISSPVRGGMGSVTISGTAFYATATALYFDFASTSNSFLLFQRDSTLIGQGVSFLCLNAGGADCSGSQFDIATQAGSTGVFGRPASQIWNFGGVLSDSGVLQVAAAVPEPSTWAMLLIGFAVISTALRRRRRRIAAEIHDAAKPI